MQSQFRLSYEDVRKSGYLRKQKSMHRRFFVLRAASEQGPARLEYYENEKKFRSKSPVPKKAVNLDSCFNINKRADSKNKHMIVLYTRGESFAIAADTEEVQNEWYQAMLDLQCKTPDECGSGGDCGLPSPGPAFKEVWQVKVWPKGLGQARNLVGIYRLCLTDKTVNFVKLNSDVAAVVLQLMNVRRCGHSENFFFIEVGRSAMTGPGEFWMQVEDSVVAQNMHETLLEAMKALSEEFRQRSKSQTVGVSCGGGTASNPISVPSRRHHPNLPPSQVGFSRRGGDEYMAMTPNSSVSPPQHIRLPINEGYMMMSPNSSCSPDLHGLSGCIWGSRGSMESRAGSDYMNMSPICARSACSTPPSHPEQQPLQPKMVYSYFSLPRSYKHTTLSTRFEDDLDRVCMGRGEAGGKVGHGGYHCGGDTPVGSGGGGQLSLSSSSFSSSSASSESLEDRSLSLSVGGVGRATRLGAGHRVGGAHPKVSAQHHHQQRCVPGVQKQGHLQSRKSSTFFVDVSKANTLPRVRETLLPTASQSPGEYVSIVYKGERVGHKKGRTTAESGNSIPQGHQRAFHQPQQCQGGSANLPRSFSAPLSTSISLSSEYVNMDLGSSPSSLTTLSSFKPTPKVREEISRAHQVEQEVEMGLRKSSMTGLTSADVASAPFTDYTEMKFGLVADTTPKSPKAGQTALPSSMEQEHNMNFPSPKAFSNVDQGARLVRAESTARRRHRSETFITPPTHPLSPSASPCPFSETPHVGPTRQQGLESNLWSNNQPPSPQCASPGVANLPAAQASSLTLEQGLNYIDLDLVSKENQTSVDGPSGPHSFFSPVVGGLTGGLGGAGGNTSSSINTYASIDFIKSDELRVHQSSRKDSKGKNTGGHTKC
uniref:Si:ch211-284e13.4 n=1 Tax=Cyprinus carpio TaxID=7962 RepID=A0A8C1MN98_CYPCA